MVFVQSFKSYYMSTCLQHDRNFLLICRHEKKILMTALMYTKSCPWMIGCHPRIAFYNISYLGIVEVFLLFTFVICFFSG